MANTLFMLLITLPLFDVPEEERSFYANCLSWHKSQDDNSEIIFFWDAEQNHLYIIEKFI